MKRLKLFFILTLLCSCFLIQGCTKKGEQGEKGTDGREVVLQVEDGYIKWQYDGEDKWNNLISLSTLTGVAGKDGTSITDIKIDNDNLIITLSNGDVKNLGNVNGLDGTDGKDGREVTFKVEEGYIKWQYVGDTSWANLIELSTLVGAKGNDGTDGKDGREVTFKVEGGYIKWQYVGDTSWTNLIELSTLVGAKGEQGDKGNDGKSAYEIYKEAHPEYTKSEQEWLDDLVNGRLGTKEETKYTVKFETNTTDTIPDQEIVSGGKVTKPQDPVKEGYTFTGWYIDDEKWVFSGYTVTSDITLVAHFTINETDSFNLKDSVKENNIYKVVVQNTINTFNFKINIELTGYKSYYVSSDENGSTIYFTKKVTLNEGDNIFYILCEKESGDIDTYKVNIYRKHLYEVVFNTNTTSTIQTKEVEEGTILKIEETITKQGYTFIGWDYDFNKPITSDLEVNAKWEANKYTFTFNPNGGKVTSTTQQVTYDSDYTLITPTYEGHAFMGWYYNDKLFEESGIWKIDKDITLVAKWSAEFNITYILDGGTNSSDNPTKYYYTTETIILKDPTKTEAVFDGWYTEVEFINKVEEIKKGSTGDITLYAKWRFSPKIIEENGSKYIYFGEYPQTLKEESVNIISNTPDKDGYYLGSDGERYAKVVAKPYGYPSSKIYFNNKQQIIEGNTYYFKVEPIKWKILSVNGIEYQLMTDLIIDYQQFNSSSSTRTIDGKTVYANNYEYSDIRKWLNDDFYNKAFNKALQSYINTTFVDNSLASTGYSSNPYTCNDTYDKVYLLSYKDITNSGYGFINDKSRQKQLTDYAKAMGCYMNIGADYYNNGYYWLRSPRYNSDGYARFVFDVGGIRKFWVTDSSVGVSAAITISLS